MDVKKELLPVVEGIILEEQEGVTLGDLCRMCSVHADYVLDLVEEGILEPLEGRAGMYRFQGDCVIRTRKAVALQRDMGVNLPGVALALQLLDEIETLRERLRRLEDRQEPVLP